MIKHLDVTGANGVRLHAASEGENGPLLLFLHGFPEFWQAWHRQLPAFSAEFRSVALDLRGCNLSDKPESVSDYELPNLVGDIRHVIRALSPDKPAILVGHDWGGIVAWTLARESPEIIDRLVILNAPHPAIFNRELRLNGSQLVASSYAGLFQIPWLAETSLQLFDNASLKKMVWGISSKPAMFPPELRAAYHEAWSRPRAIASGLNYYRNLRVLRDTVRRLEPWGIDVPTLVLWGERDPALRRENLIGLDEYVPNLTVFRHPSATHWIHHEEPEWVNAHLRDFLRTPR